MGMVIIYTPAAQSAAGVYHAAVNYNIKCNTREQKKAHTEILWYNKNCKTRNTVNLWYNKNCKTRNTVKRSI